MCWRAVTSSSQSVSGTQNYDAFGNVIGSSGSTSSPFGYGATSGYRADGDAGLLLVGARYYDAQVGRFISRDTYLDQHPYLYCNHDPVNYKDSTGHYPITEWKIYWLPGGYFAIETRSYDSSAPQFQVVTITVYNSNGEKVYID